MLKSILKRTLVYVLVLNMGLLGLPPLTLAAPIGTQELIQLEEREAYIDSIQSRLAQEEVREMLVKLGVNPIDAYQRIAALTNEELVMLEQQMDSLPAGGDGFLVVLGVVLVILIVLELTGATNVFKHLKPISSQK